jgi:DNA repair photolyase
MRASSVVHHVARHTGQDAETPLFKLLPPTLPVVERAQDPRPLLRPGPFTNQPGVLALDYILGCGHGCCFCQARLAGDGRGLDSVVLAADIPERLTEELLDQPRKPGAVFVSPTTDPFPPLQEIQDETARVVEILARHRCDVWLMTRGFIRRPALEVLCRHADRVKVTVAITTMNRTLQRALEPLTAPPNLRLRTIHSLRESGIVCNAALEPLIPGVTDTRDNLLPVLESLSQAGVRQITVGYMVLHPRAEKHITSALRPHGLDTMVMEEYARGPILRREHGLAGKYLPRSRRQHGYAAVMAMGAALGLRVSVNALTNPDFGAVQPPCSSRGTPLSLALSSS